jgi:hypothetical protein
MLSRRDLIAGGAAMTQLRAGEAVAAQRDSGSNDATASELRSIREVLVALQNKAATPTVNQIRDRQRNFLRLNQRFPECIDVGIRVWERMQDWHIENGRVLTIQRAGDGRWQMDFILSVLVLKHELPENEVGQPYDR